MSQSLSVVVKFGLANLALLIGLIPCNSFDFRQLHFISFAKALHYLINRSLSTHADAVLISLAKLFLQLLYFLRLPNISNFVLLFFSHIIILLCLSLLDSSFGSGFCFCFSCSLGSSFSFLFLNSLLFQLLFSFIPAVLTNKFTLSLLCKLSPNFTFQCVLIFALSAYQGNHFDLVHCGFVVEIKKKDKKV